MGKIGKFPSRDSAGGQEETRIQPKHCLKIKMYPCGVWWHMPVIPALGGQRQWISGSSRLAWFTQWVPGQPELRREALSQKTKRMHSPLISESSTGKDGKLLVWEASSNLILSCKVPSDIRVKGSNKTKAVQKHGKQTTWAASLETRVYFKSNWLERI